jgi:hypothetical protein
MIPGQHRHIELIRRAEQPIEVTQVVVKIGHEQQLHDQQV